MSVTMVVREGRTREGDGQAQEVRREVFEEYEGVGGSAEEVVARARRARWRERQQWAAEGYTNIRGEWWNGWTWREVWIFDDEGRVVA